MYDVSNFARDLLNRVYNDPLFNIMAINKSLYKRVRELDEIRVGIFKCFETVFELANYE